jgi:hypothetical protein
MLYRGRCPTQFVGDIAGSNTSERVDCGEGKVKCSHDENGKEYSSCIMYVESFGPYE